jgi:hypothetical protein
VNTSHIAVGDIMQDKVSEVSQKLVQVIQTRDADRVRYLSKMMERQKDPMNTVRLFWLITQHLKRIDEELLNWFQSIYFEDCAPEVREMWLQFVDLCSLTLSEQYSMTAKRA